MKTAKSIGCLLIVVSMTGLAVAQQNGASSAALAGALAEADRLDAQIGALYQQQQFDKALALAQQELALREKAQGPNHPAVGDVSRNIAELSFAKGKVKEGDAAYRRFLQIYEANFGADSPKVVDALYRYVCLLTAAHQRAEALEVQKRVFRLENGFDFDKLAVQKNKNVAQSGLIGGLLTIGEAPVYSQEAKNGGVTGPVLMKITINESGQLSDFSLISGHQLLQSAAEHAARRSTYAPAKLEGKPVKVTGLLIYDFTMTTNDTVTNPVMRPTIEK